MDTQATCVVCGEPFASGRRHRKYCSEICRNRLRRAQYSEKSTPKERTEQQYVKLSNDWPRYLSTLLTRPDRQGLSVEALLKLARSQNFRCALSGVPMTCLREQGVRFRTNASIDKIHPKDGYTVENIQLVCSAVNSWRGDTTVEEFKAWCEAVAEHKKER